MFRIGICAFHKHNLTRFTFFFFFFLLLILPLEFYSPRNLSLWEVSVVFFFFICSMEQIARQTVAPTRKCFSPGHFLLHKYLLAIFSFSLEIFIRIERSIKILKKKISLLLKLLSVIIGSCRLPDRYHDSATSALIVEKC